MNPQDCTICGSNYEVTNETYGDMNSYVINEQEVYICRTCKDGFISELDDEYI